MSTGAFLVLILGCGLLNSVDASRALAVNLHSVNAEESATEGEGEDTEFYCQDYCVKCNDGSTVWYGRSKSWFRAFINLFTGTWTMLATAAANMYMKHSREEFSHWSGYMPSTGLFCEKVDIIKFPVTGPLRGFVPEMLADRNWFGRISLNLLKPYDTNRVLKANYTEGDREAYVGGCKAVKAAGSSGRWSQFASNFQGLCHSKVTKGVFQCATHTHLCGGSSGGVAYLLSANTPETCASYKGPSPPSMWSMCPVPPGPTTPIPSVVESETTETSTRELTTTTETTSATGTGTSIASELD